MGKSAKKVALIVGVAALAATGIGLVVAPGLAGVLAGANPILAGISAVAATAGVTTLASIGLLGLQVGGFLGGAKSLENTGANSRGQAFADPNAMGVFVFGRSIVPQDLIREQRDAE